MKADIYIIYDRITVRNSFSCVMSACYLLGYLMVTAKMSI